MYKCTYVCVAVFVQSAALAAHQRINLEVMSHGKTENQRGMLTDKYKSDIPKRTHGQLQLSRQKLNTSFFTPPMTLQAPPLALKH